MNTLKCSTFWQKARRYPPCLVRIMARHPRGRLLSDAEIASRGKIPFAEVKLLGSALRWDVTLGVMERYLLACDFDFENRKQMQRIGAYLRKQPQWLHLRNDDDWTHRWLPIIKRLAAEASVADKTTL